MHLPQFYHSCPTSLLHYNLKPKTRSIRLKWAPGSCTVNRLTCNITMGVYTVYYNFPLFVGGG